jgi:hypothetical protein
VFLLAGLWRTQDNSDRDGSCEVRRIPLRSLQLRSATETAGKTRRSGVEHANMTAYFSRREGWRGEGSAQSDADRDPQWMTLVLHESYLEG